ncbi:hypothetical protein QQF64_027198 [Cirrhinus molitorella]|uniref:ribonuclease H n=1 Tax=Cirrhinus molitorella TaxID=172907 RepID=A0ABR3NBR6_9TELE
MDLVGPLPKSARGHEHILVVVDYATRYPEAIPLRKATAKNIAQELFLLCTRVGIPSEILTDQGTPFMSRLMADLCRLLRVKQLRTTVYHPQMDGLVERFNQTLKQMLKRVAAEDRKNWDLLIPYVLFGIREVPQASTGFTPFELLFGRQPRGLLDVAKEAWEQQQPALLRSTIEHVREMRERIERVMPLVKEHLTKAQQSQQRRYDRAAQPREFHPGGRVMVLVPTSACKFLATWQGPYTVIERIGPVTYRLRQPGKRREEQLYHINLLKRWVGTREQLAALAVTDPVVVDMGEELSAAQRTELQHLVSQFSDVFSTRPGRTTIIEHDIRTPPEVIVRQRPYRVPEARRQAIEDEIQEMLRLGIIEPSRSAWSSTIVMVPKPDGTLRFCNDFRRLNEVSEFDSYPMPRVDELLERLGRARFISTLDLTKGYWQVALTKSAKPKTAFSTPSGHWQYRTLPFGLHGAPVTFQRMMDVLFRPHQSYAAAHLDDVVIHSETWEEHLGRLRRVLTEMQQYCLVNNKLHPLKICRDFREKSLEDHKQFLKEQSVCFRCCSSIDHIAKKMQSKMYQLYILVQHIGRKLPFPFWRRMAGRKVTPITQEVTSKCTEVCGAGMSSIACFKICLVNVYPVGNKKESRRMYAILDEQSNHSLARTEFFDKFQIKVSYFPYSLKTCAGLKETSGRRASGYIV